MRLLLWSFTAFSSTIAATADTSDFIFPIGTQTLDSDFSWDGPDADLGLPTGDFGYDFSDNNNPALFDEGFNSDYLGYDDDVLLSAVDDAEQPRLAFDNFCSVNKRSTVGELPRENSCTGKCNA